jgi:hypothetical protein
MTMMSLHSIVLEGSTAGATFQNSSLKIMVFSSSVQQVPFCWNEVFEFAFPIEEIGHFISSISPSLYQVVALIWIYEYFQR